MTSLTDIKPYSIKGKKIVTGDGIEYEFCPKEISAEAETKEFSDEDSCGTDKAARHQGYNITSTVSGVHPKTLAFLRNTSTESVVRDGVPGTRVTLEPGALPSGLTLVCSADLRNGGIVEMRYLDVSVMSMPNLGASLDDYASTEMNFYGKTVEMTAFDRNVDLDMTPLKGSYSVIVLLNAKANGKSLLDGASIAEIANLANDDHEFEQSTSSAQPSFDIDGVSGFEAVEFDGTDDHLLLDTALTGTQALVFFLVLLHQAGASEKIVADRTAANFYIGTDAASKIEVTTDGGTTKITSSDAITATKMLLTVVVNGASSEIRFNGVQKASGDVGSNGFAGLVIGASQAIGAFAEMDLAYLEVDERSYTAAQLKEREDTLKSRFLIS